MRIYIIGKYSGKTKKEVEENIALAETYANYLLDEGYIVFCPHLSHYLHLRKYRSREFWLGYDKEWLRVCDAVFLLPGWKESEGAKEEYRLAKKLGLKIMEPFIG